MTDDESVMVLVESCEILEKSGEEGINILLSRSFSIETVKEIPRGCDTPVATVAQPETPQPTNPAVEEGKTYTVQKGDSPGRSQNSSMEWGTVFENRKCEHG